MSRIRVGYTAGEAIGPDLFRFYRSIGVNLKQFYGQTETCAYVCLQPDGQVKFDSVGPAAPGMELRIAENGEVLVRGVGLPEVLLQARRRHAGCHQRPGLLQDRRRRRARRRRPPQASSTAPRTSASWPMASMFAPKYIENKLKFFP